MGDQEGSPRKSADPQRLVWEGSLGRLPRGILIGGLLGLPGAMQELLGGISGPPRGYLRQFLALRVSPPAHPEAIAKRVALVRDAWNRDVQNCLGCVPRSCFARAVLASKCT